MKKLFTLFACALMATALWAQDIIVTTDAKKIDAKILEVTTSEIRYKELDNIDGPTFILDIDEIVTIIYANGKVVLYNYPVAEKKAREAAEAERKEKEAEAIAKANSMGSLFGSTGNSTGSGDGFGSGQKGTPAGHGLKGGHNWSLSGRSLRGTLPQPSNNFKQEGKVVVQICVNATGDVIEAKCVEGTSISDKYTQQIAINAAKKAKFSEGEGNTIGTITYNFKFN